jgi:hypothetical protein
MPLPRQIAEDVVALMGDNLPFQRLMAYWKQRDSDMKTEILSSMTDVVQREILVRVRENLEEEVTKLPERAMKELTKQTAGLPA